MSFYIERYMSRTEKIFDPLRKRSVTATPEEKVRQETIAWLNKYRHIPMEMMRSEVSFSYNNLTYRADILIYGKDTLPLMLVECKAPHVKLTKEVIEQGIRYNHTLKVKYMLFTNGKESFFCERENDSNRYRFLSEIPEIVL